VTTNLALPPVNWRVMVPVRVAASVFWATV
jgi:hypothetical protein